jgi:hypothetical protein
MILNEVVDLIKIREYICRCTDSFSINRKTLKELQDTLVLLDKKIIDVLNGSEFKTYIGFVDIKSAVQEESKLNNIKSGLK